MKTSPIDRLPPYDAETEKAVIGCQLTDPQNCTPEVFAATAGDTLAFYDLRHQEIQRVIFDLWNGQNPVDIITVQAALKNKNLLEQIGGVPYLSETIDTAYSTHNLPAWLEILCDKFLLRKTIRLCSETVALAYEGGNAASLVEGFERAALALRSVRGNKELTPIKALVNESLHDIEKMFERQGQISGLSTGLPDLDQETDGLHPAEYILIAAFPSVGKTSLAMQIAQHVALEQGHAVGIFSAEMSAKSLVTRALCSVGRVNLRGIRQGYMTESDFPKLTNAAGRLATSKIHIDDACDMTAQTMRAKARRMVQQHGIKLFIADYAQLFTSPGAENHTMELDQVSKAFKNMAKELNVPVILLSQLTKDAKGNVFLKGARALGEDADGYWMLKRPDDWEDTAETQASLGEPIELWLNKQRNEARGVRINLTFLKPYTRFESAPKFSDEDVSRKPYRD